MPEKKGSGSAKKPAAKKAAPRAKRAPQGEAGEKGQETAVMEAPAPRARAPQAAPSGPRLRVKQVKSGIGHAETYRRTLIALGLRHYQAEITIIDNPSTRGMLHKVRHLVRVTPEGV